MSLWSKIYGPTVWGARSSRQMKLFKLLRQGPYLIGGLVSHAARADGPPIFPSSIATSESPGYVRRNWGSEDPLMEEYYFG